MQVLGVVVIMMGVLTLRTGVAGASGSAPGIGWFNSGGEQYLFPGVVDMSNPSTSAWYSLQSASNVTVVVLNSSHQVVKTIESGVSENACSSWYCYFVSWDGTNTQRQIVAPGQYTVQVTAANGGGSETISQLADVANPGVPGSLTSPTNGTTLQGTTGFVFAPRTAFPVGYTLTQVDVSCIGASYASSGDGTWRGSGDTNQCANGPQQLTNTVYFTDPLGAAQSWVNPSGPSVTVTNGPGLSWLSGGTEQYLFPGVAGMSGQSTSSYYALQNASNVTITVLNSSLQVVKTLQTGTSESACYYYCHYFTWDGTNDQSQTVAPGQYTVHITGTNKGATQSIDQLVDVANPGPPGSLTSPTDGATVQGTIGFVFAPRTAFPVGYTLTQVDVSCIGASYAPTGDGTWQGTGNTTQCANGPQQLTDTVYFTDPLGTPQTWTDPNAPTVTLNNATPPGLSWYSGGAEQYLFPGVAGMSGQSTSSYYALQNTSDVTVTVLSPSHQVVKTLQPSTSESACYYYCHHFSWDGTNDQSQTVAPGQYTVQVTAVDSSGTETIDQLADVANPGPPGSLTSPTTNGTLTGLTHFVFTPTSSSMPGSSITQVDFCLSTGGCVTAYNPSPNGTWQTTELTGSLVQGPATLTTSVYFKDPLGASQNWTDGGTPVSVNTTSLALQASLDTTRGTAPLATNLTVNASDPGGLPLTYVVNFGDGSATVTGTIAYPYDPITLPHTFAAARLDTVNVSVSDSASGFAQQQLNVSALNPTLPIQLTPTPASGTAPLTSTFTLTTSDVSGQPVNYDIAFGDGQATSGTINSPYLPLTIGHTYSTPGTFNAGGTVSDTSGTTGRAVAVVTASGVIPLAPNSGEAQTGIAGKTVTLDGSGSQPSGSITSYQWTFGDGSTGSGAIVSHAYSTAGTYTATLTVSANGRQAVSNTQVTIVAPPAPTKGLSVTVNDGSSPLVGAAVAVVTSDGTRYSGTTDSQGLTVIGGLPDGSSAVYAYEPGYLPNTASGTQTNGSGSVTITLQPGSVAQTSATSTPLTEQQIVAAGINPNDPANQNVYQFEIHLAFVAGPASQPVDICGDLTGNGVVNPVIAGGATCSGGGGGGGGGGGLLIGGGGGGDFGGGGTCTGLCFSVGDYEVIGQATQSSGEPAILWMIIPGKAKWLKEFFDVKMVVSNLAPTGSGFSFDNGSISLGALPAGLSLAPTGIPQTVTQQVAKIPAGGSATADWILRGDAEGFYTVTGNFSGTLNPIGVALSLPISTATGAIHVWGGSAIHMIVDTDSQATLGYPYLVRIGLENVADVPVYNASVELLTQGRLNYIYQPQERLAQATDTIQPGATFWTSYYRLVSEITGTLDLGKSFVKKTAGNVDVASTIESHPATPVSQVPTLTASSAPDGVHLSWQAPAVTGITGYEVFYTPTRDTLFGATPLSTVSASTLSTVIANAAVGYYAVTAVVNGVPKMFSPLEAGSPQGPLLSLSKNSGSTGSKSVASGTGFGVGQNVKFYLDTTSSPSIGSTKSSSVGAFSKSVTITASAVGLHSVIAVAGSGNQASASFTISIPSYVALGDSYSSGEANSPFTDNSGCDVSQHTSWPLMVASYLKQSTSFHDLACSGAGIWSLFQPWNAKGQLSQVSWLPIYNPTFVTVTIGGNSFEQGTSPSNPDWGFANIVTDCYLFDCSADGTLARADSDVMNTDPVNGLRARLASAYRSIKSDSPGSRVLVVGYPNIFPASLSRSTLLHCPWIQFNSEYSGLGKLANDLNSTVAGAASDAGVSYVSTLNVLNGHTLCTSKSYVQDISAVNGIINSSAGHPIAPGQAAMAKAVEQWIKLNP
jgi:flagellar hook assembly protein FlgD